MPAAALASEELLEALHVYIDTLPEREDLNAPAGGFDAHLAGPQKRGAYVYDAVPGEAGVYRLAALPRTPLTVDELPAKLRAYLGNLKLGVALGTERVWIGKEGRRKRTVKTNIKKEITLAAISFNLYAFRPSILGIEFPQFSTTIFKDNFTTRRFIGITYGS